MSKHEWSIKYLSCNVSFFRFAFSCTCIFMSCNMASKLQIIYIRSLCFNFSVVQCVVVSMSQLPACGLYYKVVPRHPVYKYAASQCNLLLLSTSSRVIKSVCFSSFGVFLLHRKLQHGVRSGCKSVNCSSLPYLQRTRPIVNTDLRSSKPRWRNSRGYRSQPWIGTRRTLHKRSRSLKLDVNFISLAR